MPKKTEREFLNIHSVAKQKNEGETFGEVSQCRKKLKEGSFGLVRYCMLRGKPFWFSSLGQRVQFGVFLKFCIIFGVELFWSLQVYRKKSVVFRDEISETKILKPKLFNSTQTSQNNDKF